MAPALLAFTVFAVAMYAYLLPAVHQALLGGEMESVRKIATSAVSTLQYYEAKERRGELSREEAQQAAIDILAAWRYGPEGRDYLWMQDTVPRMIMHPYRHDLVQQSLRDYRDSGGALVFQNMVDVIRREGQGWVDYVWQRYEDTVQQEPKRSYICGFAPWGWIIGTGVYVDHVEEHITALTG